MAKRRLRMKPKEIPGKQDDAQWIGQEAREDRSGATNTASRKKPCRLTNMPLRERERDRPIQLKAAKQNQ